MKPKTKAELDALAEEFAAWGNGPGDVVLNILHDTIDWQDAFNEFLLTKGIVDYDESEDICEGLRERVSIPTPRIQVKIK